MNILIWAVIIPAIILILNITVFPFLEALSLAFGNVSIRFLRILTWLKRLLIICFVLVADVQLMDNVSIWVLGIWSLVVLPSLIFTGIDWTHIDQPEFNTIELKVIRGPGEKVNYHLYKFLRTDVLPHLTKKPSESYKGFRIQEKNGVRRLYEVITAKCIAGSKDGEHWFYPFDKALQKGHLGMKNDSENDSPAIDNSLPKQ